MKRLLRWCFLNLTARYPATVLLVALVLSGVSVYIASDLRYNPRLDNLLPEDMELVQEFNHVIEKMGGSGPLAIVVEGLNETDAPKVLPRLAQRLEQVPGVRYVDYRLPTDILQDHQLLLASRRDLEKIETMIDEAVDYARNQLGGFFGSDIQQYNPETLRTMAEDYYIFSDINPYYRGRSGKHYFIFVQPEGTSTNTDFTKTFVQNVRKEIANSGLEREFPGLKINLSGSMITRLEENETIVRDLKRCALAAAVLATLAIAVYTRSLFSIILILFPLALSLTYTFALTRLLIGHVNIISGFLVAILMGLGVDYGIHLYIRFKQELLKGLPTPKAVELVVTQVGRSGVVAMLTTLSVFTLLIFSEFRGFSEFGKIAAMGIISAFLTYYFLFPAQVLWADRIHWLRKPRPRRFHLNISRLYTNTPYFIVSLFLLILVASIIVLPKVEFEYDFQKLRGESPAAEYETQTTEDFGYAFSPTVIMTPDKENLHAIQQALEKVKMKYGEESTLGLYSSLNLFSQKEYESKKDILERLKRKLNDEQDIIELSIGTERYNKLRKLVNAGPFDEKQLPDNIIKRFTAGDEYLALILSPSDKNFFDVRNIYQLEKEMKDFKQMMAREGIQVAIMNENLLAAEILDWVKQKGPRALLMAVGIVFMILLIDLRSFRLTIKTFLPLLTGLALTGALMTVFNVKLNFINIVMLPSIVGLMIDHCIYLGHHILDYNEHQTVKSLQETGSSIILSALTTLCGYASLNLAHHAGVKSIATVMELGIISCTFCALFMLPALFELRLHKLTFKRTGNTGGS